MCLVTALKAQHHQMAAAQTNAMALELVVFKLQVKEVVQTAIPAQILIQLVNFTLPVLLMPAAEHIPALDLQQD